MLKMTQIQLELMTDIDMYQFMERGIRGSVSCVARRYGKASNKYIGIMMKGNQVVILLP